MEKEVKRERMKVAPQERMVQQSYSTYSSWRDWGDFADPFTILGSQDESEDEIVCCGICKQHIILDVTAQWNHTTGSYICDLDHEHGCQYREKQIQQMKSNVESSLCEREKQIGIKPCKRRPKIKWPTQSKKYQTLKEILFC